MKKEYIDLIKYRLEKAKKFVDEISKITLKVMDRNIYIERRG
jgi:hypothetical protein